MTAKRFLPDGTPVNAHDETFRKRGFARKRRGIPYDFWINPCFPKRGGVGIKEGNPERARPKPVKGSPRVYSIKNSLTRQNLRILFEILTAMRRPFE